MSTLGNLLCPFKGRFKGFDKLKAISTNDQFILQAYVKKIPQVPIVERIPQVNSQLIARIKSLE